MSDTKLCKDCKHARKPFLGFPTPFRPWMFAKCAVLGPQPQFEGYTAVDRRTPAAELDFCRTHRVLDHGNWCGPDAKHWEPRS